MIKKIFNVIVIIFISLSFFLIFDFFLSRYTDFFHIKKSCIEYFKIKQGNQRFYSYDLAKNCKAFEHKGKTPAYNVFTNEKGFRVGKNKIKKSDEVKKQKIIFLGDSFTYGFGVNYYHSVPGYIEKKSNFKYDIINLGIPGYSPSTSLFKLKEYLKNDQKIKIKKIIYILDLTDVHDESNRWLKLKNINRPVINDKSVEKEIQKTFDFKNTFRTSRFLAFLLNKNLRNFRKEVKNIFSKKEIEKTNKTFWGSFTHTNEEVLLINKDYRSLWTNNKEIGFEKIKHNVKLISEIADNYNAQFYISIHPWLETIEFGQGEFDWENFAKEVCIASKCTKLINFFTDVKKIRKFNENWREELYFREDLHLNKNGNDLYSDRIYKDAFN